MIRKLGTIFFVPVLIAAGWWLLVPPAPQSQRESSLPIQTVARTPEGMAPSCLKDDVPSHLKHVGVASCSTSNCHGEASKRKQGNTFHNEVSIWETKDKGHSRANQSLTSERGKMILAALQIKVGAEVLDSVGYTNCQKCHDPMMTGPGKAYSQGVSCESCHGPAEKWLDSHDTRGFVSSPSIGMRDTENLLKRARVCADCHVGSVDRDVSHDLIAAGHPPLKYDFSSFMYAMPKHWDHEAERRKIANYEVEAWSAGQIASAEASLMLLEARAARATEAHQGATWPEFSEQNCYSCHHDLAWPSWRQQRGYGTRKAGRPTWGSWYFSPLAMLSRQQEGNAAAKSFNASLESLGQTMEGSLAPNAETVRQQAAATRQELKNWVHSSGSAAGMGIRPDTVAAMMSKDAADSSTEAFGESVVSNWETATQIYLTAVVLNANYLDRLDATGGKETELDKQISAAIGRIADKLGYMEGYDSPKTFLGEAGDESPTSLRAELRKELLFVIENMNGRPQ